MEKKLECDWMKFCLSLSTGPMTLWKQQFPYCVGVEISSMTPPWHELEIAVRLCKLPPNPVGSKVKSKVVNEGKWSVGFVLDSCIEGNGVMELLFLDYGRRTWRHRHRKNRRSHTEKSQGLNLLIVRQLVSHHSCVSYKLEKAAFSGY